MKNIFYGIILLFAISSFAEERQVNIEIQLAGQDELYTAIQREYADKLKNGVKIEAYVSLSDQKMNLIFRSSKNETYYVCDLKVIDRSSEFESELIDFKDENCVLRAKIDI
ncbi:MAG: hypothetical protein VX642_00965 [Bdellovibrionota bacterium]|nr:hypothetical protein [Bdellovibrionota bacterium]